MNRFGEGARIGRSTRVFGLITRGEVLHRQERDVDVLVEAVFHGESVGSLSEVVRESGRPAVIIGRVQDHQRPEDGLSSESE